MLETSTTNLSGRRYFPPFPHDTLANPLDEPTEPFDPAFSEENTIGKADLLVSQILLYLGFVPKSKGFLATKTACLLIFGDRHYFENLKNLLYPEVARLLGSTPSRAEQQIRTALGHSCRSGKIRNLNELFGLNLVEKRVNVSSREFFGFIDLALRMEFGIIL